MDKNMLDRAEGVLLGTAVGDALGAGYEFGLPLRADEPIGMIGGGLGDGGPGEWTDDTEMSICIGEVLSQNLSLDSTAGLDLLTRLWVDWEAEAKDVGMQTSTVLGNVSGINTSFAAFKEAQELHKRTGLTAGNGSLMRTSVVALSALEDRNAVAQAVKNVARLTHYDPEAVEACTIWTEGVRYAIQTGTLDGVYSALELLDDTRADVWQKRLKEAEQYSPDIFERNGWVVHALQGAWSSINIAMSLPPTCTAQERFTVTVETAVRGGGDTDTVAAIAGALAGGYWGAAAIDENWVAKIYGWPDYTAKDLKLLTHKILKQ